MEKRKWVTSRTALRMVLELGVVKINDEVKVRYGDESPRTCTTITNVEAFRAYYTERFSWFIAWKPKQ